MALTFSKQDLVGTKGKPFSLLDVCSNQKRILNDLASEKATVIMFICNHCPYVKHLNQAMVTLANEFIAKGVAFIAINSNDALTYPEDNPENMKKTAQKYGYPFSYLFDETQEVAKAYQALCTPEFYVYDKNLICQYHGQFDDSRPGLGEPTGADLRKALEEIMIKGKVSTLQKPSMGCNIKWIPST